MPSIQQILFRILLCLDFFVWISILLCLDLKILLCLDFKSFFAWISSYSFRGNYSRVETDFSGISNSCSIMGKIHAQDSLYTFKQNLIIQNFLNPHLLTTLLCLSNHSWYGLFSQKSNKNPAEPESDYIPVVHWIWTPNEAFFHQNPKLLGLGKQFGQINFGEFSNNLSAPILILWVRCPCFPLINHYWDWDLNLNLGRKELGI